MPTDRAFALFRKALYVAVLAMAPAALAFGQSKPFSPPRITQAELPSQVPPQVLGGGEVLIELTVTRGGMTTKPTLLRGTAPFSEMMLDALRRWVFLPATAFNPKLKTIEPVDAPVLIAAVFRPPALYDGPTLGESPREMASASRGVAVPAALVPPLVPPNAAPSTALFGANVLFEVLVDEFGKTVGARPVMTAPGYESAARDALAQWRFRPAQRDGRPVPAVVYVLFGFRAPLAQAP